MIILVRHAQSVKNLKNIHGGEGESLTGLGETQAIEWANKLFCRFGKERIRLYTPKNIQAVETANIFASLFGCNILTINDFKPLNFGVFHGKSDKYMADNFPTNYALLLKWRKREIDISELNIPEMEEISSFWQRGMAVLDAIDESLINILVCTNSLFILLAHILSGHTYEKGGGYKHISIPNCGMAAFYKIGDKNWIPISEFTDIII